MLLVLISLAMATIVTIGYLASRDNSTAIGENVAAAASARWASESGLELGIAVLETESDWRTSHVAGKLIDDYAIGPAIVDIDLLDLETGTPPTAGTTYVRILSTALVDGVTQLAIAEATVDDSGDGPDGVTVDLSEFAVFAGDTITLRDDSLITRWTAAPASALGKRVALGTQDVAAGSIDLGGAAAVIDGTLYHPSGASASLVLNASSPAVDQTELDGTIPMPDPPDPPTLWEGFSGFPGLIVNGSASVTNDLRYDWINVQSTVGRLAVNGDHTIIADHDLRLEPNSRILVDGHATIVVNDNFTMQDSSYIELTENATLTIFVGGDVSIDDGFIGEQRADKTLRDNTGTAEWIDPERIRIYSIGDSTNKWSMYDNTVVKASLYAPPKGLEIKDTSALYGRVAVQALELKDDAAIFYDHALDRGNGYTNPNSALYKTDGSIEDSIAALAKLDDASLQTLAEELGVSVKALAREIAVAAADPDPGPPPGPSDPTPRTVAVDYRVTSFGSDVTTWEVAAAGD